MGPIRPRLAQHSAEQGDVAHQDSRSRIRATAVRTVVMAALHCSRVRHAKNAEDRAAEGDSGRPAQPQHLAAARMVFDSEEQPRGPEESAAHLQVPAIVPAPAQHAGALGAQARLHRPEPLVLFFAVLRPDRRRDGPEWRQRGCAVTSPGRESLTQAPAQTGERLYQMKRRRQQAPTHPGRPTGGGQVRESGAGGAEPRLRERR